ncbi:MAG: aminotransferase class V-fold PLP-dependent enzyme [Erysipelotrichaceae bacterium]|nr:aminotransferase class V-fold PLP-dependent enzyme [Erysipelotrichaceae bacterium]
MIYLDYTANCPTEKDVLDTYINTTYNYYANPNSFHDLGIQAKELLNKNSLEILQLLHKEDADIIYTSAASESNNLVVKGIVERYKNRGKHIIIGSFEHNSITVPISKLQQSGYEVDIVPVNKDGIVDLEELEYLLRDDTILVSICSVDSELGIRQPIEKIGKMLKNYSCYFHSDASQAIGKTEIDFSDVDLITMTPHKFYGINGSGALIKNKNIGLVPIIDGGKSTTEFRSGTPVLANVTAMKKALELATINYAERYKIVSEYHDYLITSLNNILIFISTIQNIHFLILLIYLFQAFHL